MQKQQEQEPEASTQTEQVNPVQQLKQAKQAKQSKDTKQAISETNTASNTATTTTLKRGRPKNKHGKPQEASSQAHNEGRKLRSKDTIRFKSDLSAYFPDYDEVIGNDPKPKRKFSHLFYSDSTSVSGNVTHVTDTQNQCFSSPDTFDLDTPIQLVGSPTLVAPAQGIPPVPLASVAAVATGTAGTTGAAGLTSSGVHPAGTDADVEEIKYHNGWPIRGYGDNLFTDLCDSQELSFSFMDARNTKGDAVEDPLPDSYFEPAHKKAEKAERSIRNTERVRASTLR